MASASFQQTFMLYVTHVYHLSSPCRTLARVLVQSAERRNAGDWQPSDASALDSLNFSASLTLYVTHV